MNMKLMTLLMSAALIPPPPTKSYLDDVESGFGVLRAAEGEDEEEKKKAAAEALTKQVNEIVHKALTERDKRFEKKLADTFASFETTLGEKIGALIPKPKGDEDEGDKGKKGAKGTEEYKALEAKVAAMQKERDEEKAKRTEAEAKALRTEEARTLTTLLTEQKVRPAVLGMATRDLHGRFLVRDEEGAIKWKKANGELVDPTDGWSEFAKTDEGKELIAPKDGAGGGGSRQPNRGGAAGAGGENFGYADLGSRLIPGSGRG